MGGLVFPFSNILVLKDLATSLLKIPFGIYKKESVLTIIDDIKIKIELLLDNTINILEEFKESHIYQNIYIIDLIILCKSHKKLHLY